MSANSILDILNARDKRVEVQKELISKFKKPLISFTLNIAGNIKRSFLYDIIFEEGLQSILLNVEDEIIYKKVEKEMAGCIAFIVVNCDVKILKKRMVEIENSRPSSRLFDIDVIQIDGVPISRGDLLLPSRKCIICNKDYLECRRSGNHSLENVILKTNTLAINECAALLSNIASYCLKAELYTTPKPGLVDLNNNGSHDDMSFELFLSSIGCITPFLKQEFLAAFEIDEKITLFKTMRAIGIEAEKSMLSITDGVNTHKGAFFSLSVVGCGICYLVSNNEMVSVDKIRAFSTEFGEWAYDNNETTTSNGYNARKNNKKIGIFYEAKKGYPSVFEKCENYLNIFKDARYKKYFESIYTSSFDCQTFFENIQEITLRVFCNLLSSVYDSNIVHRGGIDKLSNMHMMFKDIQSKDLSFTTLKEKLLEADSYFIKNNLSPGGSADLLTIVLFIMILKSINIIL